MDETPLLRDLAIEADAARVAKRRADNVIWREDDTLAVQLRDLVDWRALAVDLTADELDARVRLELPASRQGS